MIMFFRNLSESWVAKLLLLLIALSMGGLFGLGQMTSYWGAKTDAIRVGDIAVKPQELARDVEKKARQTSSLTGQYVSIQQALAMGVLPQVITSKISAILSDIMAKDLGLFASSNAVGNYITNNPNFQTITGAYDPSLVQAYMNQMQMSEAELTAALRNELAKKHLSDAILSIVSVSNFSNQALYAYRNERRDFETILLPSTAVKIDEKPTEQDLREYYEAMEDSLYMPEYRQLTVLRLTPSALASSLTVTDDEAKAFYDSKLDIYTTPEKRRVEQILVKDKDAAQELFNKLTPANFAQIAEENGQKTEDTQLGWIEKTGVIEEIGEAVFSAEKEKVLAPIESQLGFHILIVREIEEAKQTSFNDAKDEIKKTIQGQRAYDILVEKSKLLDNALGEGQSLTDAAKLVSLKTDEQVWTDAAGMGLDEKTAVKLPPELLQKAFALKAKEVTPLYDFEDGYIVAQIDDVRASSLKSFDAARDQVIAEWTKDKQKKHATDFAQIVLKEAKKAKKLEDVAKKYKLETENLTEIRREDAQGIPSQYISDLFQSKENDFMLIPATENDFIIVKTTKVIPADIDDTVAKTLFDKALIQQMSDTLYSEVLSDYAKQNKVEINQSLINEFFEPYMKKE